MPDETEYDFGAHFDIQELVDEEGLQELFDAFYAATGIAASIISLEGRVLAGAGWQRICTKFHRKLPVSKRMCLENDTRLTMELVQTCRETIQRCPHGLMSAAVPILIDGRHMANLLSGEFLAEPPDTKIIAEFKARADRFGFDRHTPYDKKATDRFKLWFTPYVCGEHDLAVWLTHNNFAVKFQK